MPVDAKFCHKKPLSFSEIYYSIVNRHICPGIIIRRLTNSEFRRLTLQVWGTQDSSSD
jgi:hypothetical protein